MENAVDAFKIAFAVFIFVIALTLAFSVVGQARATSEAVLYMTDKNNDYDYVSATDNNASTYDRIVSFETILPVIYRYAKEQYAVTIVKNDGTPIVRYDLYTEGFMANWNTILKRKKDDVYGPNLEQQEYNEVQARIAKVDSLIQKETGKENAIWDSININDNSKKGLYAGKSNNAGGIHIVSPWMSNPNTEAIKRIAVDIADQGTEYEKNGVIYYGKNLSQYKDMAFKEKFIEIQTIGETIVETDEENNTEYALDVKDSDKKLEIIYILQENIN